MLSVCLVLCLGFLYCFVCVCFVSCVCLCFVLFFCVCVLFCFVTLLSLLLVILLFKSVFQKGLMSCLVFLTQEGLWKKHVC